MNVDTNFTAETKIHSKLPIDKFQLSNYRILDKTLHDFGSSDEF